MIAHDLRSPARATNVLRKGGVPGFGADGHALAHLVHDRDPMSLLDHLMPWKGRREPDEHRALPGDDLLAAPRAQATHHVDIAAPPEQVWPWLVQMGCGRAGWYSWDFLDNGGVPSADRIIPSLQRISVGDILPMRPKRSDGFAVLAIDPPRSLVLGDPSLLPGRATPSDAPRGTWAFSLEPIGENRTHLVVRVRIEYQPGLQATLLRPVVRGVHAVMERKQLRTLKQRVESRSPFGG